MGAVVYEKCPLWSDGSGDPYASVKAYIPGSWEGALFALRDEVEREVERAALAKEESRRAQVDAELLERWGIGDGAASRVVHDDVALRGVGRTGGEATLSDSRKIGGDRGGECEEAEQRRTVHAAGA